MDDKVDILQTNFDTNSLNLSKINNGSWKTPFVILFFFIIGSGIGMYLFYLKLVKKMHYR